MNLDTSCIKNDGGTFTLTITGGNGQFFEMCFADFEDSKNFAASVMVAVAYANAGYHVGGLAEGDIQ